MHHVALDRAGSHDRHFDHEIVEISRHEPRQHGHLRAALHLEHAERIRAGQHAVNGGILRLDGGERISFAIVLIHHIQRLAQARQHAEAENVDFQNAKGIEIVLVPFDEGAFIHRRIADRHDFVESAAGDDKATDMLGEMAWEAIDFLARAKESGACAGFADRARYG